MGYRMKNILAKVFKKSRKHDAAEDVYKCWICSSITKDHREFLYHIHECNAVKNSGLPLYYISESKTWRFNREALLEKNKVLSDKAY